MSAEMDALRAAVDDVGVLVDAQAAEIDALHDQLRRKPVGVYSPQAEAGISAVEARCAVPAGTLVPTWFFFPSITSATALAVQRQVAPMAAAGRDVIVNLSTANATWADVAAGRYDATLQPFISALAATPGWRRFVFEQEPDLARNHAPNFERGTPPDHDAAARHIRSLLPQNARLGFCAAVASRFPTWCVTPWLYDFYSLDAYNRSVSGWMLPTELAARDLPYLPDNGRPVTMTTGSVTDSGVPDRRATWVNDLQNVDLAEVVYWQSGDATGSFALTTDMEFAALGDVAT